MPATDHELLDHFLKTGDQAPFTELVRRHLGLVHSAAIRITNQATLAEEVSQVVFTKLARLRSPMQTGLSMVTWLHRTTRSTAIDLVRAEVRRRNREQTAASLAMNHASIPWEEISPVLDDVIDKLSPDERHVVLSRFFEGQSHAELGRALGLSEDAVRMRVNRSLEKIRGLLQKRGITTTASALSAALPAHALAAVPAGLASTVVSVAVASFTPSISIITLGIITMTKKTAIIAATVLLVAGTGTAIYIASAPKAAPSSVAADSKNHEAAGTLADADSPDSYRAKSRDRKASKGSSDGDADLVSQYGESRVKLAKRVSTSLIGFLGEDGILGLAASVEEQSKGENLGELGRKLALSDAQRQQALTIYQKHQAAQTEHLKSVGNYLNSNSKVLREVLLAGDAYKRNKVSKEEYDAIASRLDSKQIDLNNSMNIGSMDLTSQQEFMNELKPFLDPSQIRLLEEGRAQVAVYPGAGEAAPDQPDMPLSFGKSPETLEKLDEQTTSMVTMINGFKAAVDGMKVLQGKE